MFQKKEFKMKMRLSILVVLTSVLICFSSAYAATFTMEIEDVSDLDIASFCLKFNVSDFEFTSFSWGGSISFESGYEGNGWVATSEGTIDEMGRLVIDAYDEDALYELGYNGLTDGTLFTIEYTGTLESISFEELLVYNDSGTAINLLNTGEFEIIMASSSGIIKSTAAVPVPSAFLLFFTGLCSFAGLTRRQR